MIVRSCAIFCLLINIGLAAELDRQKSEPTISECAAKGGECDETKGRPVCGTDDQTYPSRCHLIRGQCSGHQVSLKHRGPCKECLEARAYALKHKLYGKNPAKFIPKCRTDGTYASVQCLEDHGCWCSDSSGKPIPNTTVRNGKPNCKKYSRSNNRRSPPRIIGPASRNRRICTQVDQALFNSNLIKVFQSEYSRVHLRRDAISSATAHQANTITDKIILDWKFAGLDVNGNHMLDKPEYRELKRLVKKVIKPRRCARAFGKFCDIDQDERLSLLEWSNCLSRDGVNRQATVENGSPATGQTSSSSVAHHHQTTTTHHSHNVHPVPLDDSDGDEDDESSQHLGDYTESDEYGPDESDDDDNISYNSFGSMASKNTNSAVTQFPSIYFLRPKSVVQEPPLRVSEGESDCLSDRAAALEEERNGGTALYVPECTADGRYQRVQCYRSTGYCWCVHEDTGKNIPGTSVKDKRPQCDSIYPVSRPMKGCPEQKKADFLRELKEFLKNQVGANGNTGANNTNWTSEDEKIATLSFVLLDKNKNKVWERKEWKTFRDLVTASQPLRKCGKKMPRYCDVNSDKEITLSEWLNCLEAQRIETAKPAQSNSKFNGPNPLDSYLKE